MEPKRLADFSIEAILQDLRKAEGLYSQQTSFNRRAIKCFKSIIHKVPDEIITVFNELCLKPDLKDHILETIKSSQAKAKDALNLLEKISTRRYNLKEELLYEANSFVLKSEKVKKTICSLNKVFLANKFAAVYLSREQKSNEVAKNVLYLPLHSVVDLCPVFSLLAAPSHNKRSLICANWFHGPLFMNAYHLLSGAYPVINNTFAEKFINLKKLSKLKIIGNQAILGQADTNEFKTFNKRVCEHLLDCFSRSTGNSLLLYPESRLQDPYQDLRFDTTELHDPTKQIKVPNTYARWIAEALKRDPNTIIKTVTASIQNDMINVDPKKGISHVDKFLIQRSKGHADYCYVAENIVKTKKIKDLDDTNKINLLLADSYSRAREQLSHMILSREKQKNILQTEQLLLNSKLQNIKDFSLNKFIQDLCRSKSIAEIKKLKSYEIVTGLGLDLGLLLDNYQLYI